MNYMLIFGVIGLIAVVALVSYFMLGKTEGIKDGKYANEGQRLYITISKNRVQFWVDERQTGSFTKFLDFDIIKSDMKVSIEGKERVAYVSTTPIDRKSFYIAQSPSDVLFFYTLKNGVLEQIQEKEFNNLKKVE